MGRFGDWINRQRHNRGYGVQSPSSFFFVTEVLKERLPYYAYPILEEIAKESDCSAKRLKELFRITNHHNPANCIAINSLSAACAMATAKPSASKHCITATQPSPLASALLANYDCPVKDGNLTELFESTLQEIGKIGMLYIGTCPQRAELLETALRYTNDNSIIVIEGINGDEATKVWWQKVVDNPATVVTYDLYSTGLLYFNRERRKQHYTLKR